MPPPDGPSVGAPPASSGSRHARAAGVGEELGAELDAELAPGEGLEAAVPPPLPHAHATSASSGMSRFTARSVIDAQTGREKWCAEILIPLLK